MSKLATELFASAAGAAVSYAVIADLRKRWDPIRKASKEALERIKEITQRFGRPHIQTNPYEDVVARDVVNPDNIDVTFDSIGGYDHIKQELNDLFILPLQKPELFSCGMLVCPQKGVLLYGPPGTGKTMFAKAIAKESGAVFINVRVSNLMNEHFGEAQKLVAALFTLAKKLQPTIIFIDEADGLLSRRRTTEHEALTGMKTEFMSQWDGFTTDQHDRVVVLAATNRPSELDEAVLRRLPHEFEIGIPNRKERAEILKVILKDEKVENGIDYDHVAGLCDGCTGSDLLELCKKAALFRIGDLLNDVETGEPSQERRPLSQSDLERVIAETTKTSVAISEYSETSSHSSGSSRQRGSDDDHVQDAINLFDQLQNWKKNNLSMREYLNKVKVCCDTLAAIGEKVSEADQVLLILGGLGSDYNDVISSVTSRAQAFSLNELTSLLLSYESRLESAAQVNNEGSLLSANVAVQNQSNRPNENTQSGRGRGSNQNCRGGRNNGRGCRARGGRYGNNRPTCQLCHYQGHTADKCDHRLDVNFPPNFGNKNQRNSGDGSANFSQTINDEGSLPSANVAVQNQSNRSNQNTQSGRGRGLNQNYRGGRSNGRVYCGRGGGYGNNRPTCQVCHQGHTADKCFHRFDVNFTPNFGHQNQRNSGDGSANFSRTMNNQNGGNFAAPDYNTEYSWYPDSGAFNHITSDLSNLNLASEYLGADKVQIGNGSGLNIAHVGNALVSFSLSQNSRIFKLNKLLHIPHITRNLLSVAQFAQDNHVFFEFHPLHCLVKVRATGQVLLKGTRENGLYKFKLIRIGKPPSPQLQSQIRSASSSDHVYIV